MKTYSGYITILGSPNVGKSTLLNLIVGRKISIVSDKPQTTRDKITGIYTKDNKQLVFLDTPGIGKPIGSLGFKINKIAEDARIASDLVMWVLDSTKGIGQNDLKIMEDLKRLEIPVITVFNKTDCVSQKKVMGFVVKLNESFPNTEFIPISALNGANVDKLIDLLLNSIPENPFLFDADESTTQTDEFVISEFVREQVYINSEKEVPYSTDIVVENIEDIDDETMSAEVKIIVGSVSHRRMLIGKNASFIKNVRQFAKKRLKTYFKKRVMLDIRVKLQK